jgi:hypothetical protein
MLARTPFKTAQELGVREIEHEYLIRFVTEGEAGRLPEQHRFNMNYFLEEASDTGEDSCGTVGCIAGTMQHYAIQDDRCEALGKDLCGRFTYRVGSAVLHDLFMPQEDGELMDKLETITLSQAVSCTKHFLLTGEVNWPLALGAA